MDWTDSRFAVRRDGRVEGSITMGGEKRGRRWLRLSVRGMILLVLVVGLWAGWWISGTRRQQRALEVIGRSSVSTGVAYEDGSSGWMNENPPGTPATGDSWWPPEWLRKRMGPDWFLDVTEVSLGGKRNTQHSEEDADATEWVVKLKKVEKLQLLFSVTDEQIAKVATMPKVKSLMAFPSPKLTEEGLRSIGGMKKLEELQLMGTPVTDSGLEHLEGLVRLERLAVGGPPRAQSGSSPARIEGVGLPGPDGLPALTDLVIMSRDLTAEGLDAIGAHTRLKTLWLQGGAFTDNDLKPLARLSELEQLTITDVGIDGTGVRELKGLEKLSQVTLRGRKVSDEAIPYLAGLPGLTILDLSRTSVTAEGLRALSQAKGLESLRLSEPLPGNKVWLKATLPECVIIVGQKPL